MASGETGRSFGCHACFCRYALVALATVTGRRDAAKLPARMIVEIAEADPHVTMQRARNSYRNAKSHDAVGYAEGVDVAVAKEQDAGDDSPNEGDGGEDRIRQMSEREDGGGSEDGGHLPGQKPR